MPIVHLEVAGRVQGVGFRWFVKELAREHSIAGWVRNLSSGNMEVAASGSEEAVQALLDAVRQGPPGAEVRQLIMLSPQGVVELPLPFTVLK